MARLWWVEDCLQEDASVTTNQVDTMIQLVGSNSLPNYLSAMTLRAKTVLLVHTPEILPVAHCLERVYKKRDIAVSMLPIESATDVSACVNAIQPHMGGYHLDYTGGTKTMSASIFWSWMKMGGDFMRASYVDDGRGVIRFAGGPQIDINVHLTLEDLVVLHGLRKFKERPLSDDLAREMQLKGGIRKTLDAVVDGLRHDQFLSGCDFEDWVAYRILETGLVERQNIHVGVKAFQNETHFELDILATRGHRVYVLSCSLEDYKTSKLKGFELVMRGRQIAGDLVRPAFVGTLDTKGDTYKGGMTSEVCNMESTLRAFWNAPNQFKVFGLSHLQEWTGAHGAKVSLQSLSRWLES